MTMTQQKRSLLRGLFRRHRAHDRLLPKHRQRRAMLAEALEQRQMLAADVPGDDLTSAQTITLQPSVMTQLDATIGDGNYGNADIDLFRVDLSASP